MCRAEAVVVADIVVGLSGRGGLRVAHFGRMGHNVGMNKDISNMILDLCSAIECVRPLSTQEQSYRQRAMGIREGAWMSVDDNALRSFVGKGMPRQEIAERMSRSNMSVRKRIQSLRRSGFIESVR